MRRSREVGEVRGFAFISIYVSVLTFSMLTSYKTPTVSSSSLNTSFEVSSLVNVSILDFKAHS